MAFQALSNEEKISEMLFYVRKGGRLVKIIVDASGKCVNLGGRKEQSHIASNRGNSIWLERKGRVIQKEEIQVRQCHK